jgi:hypothetical protein
MLEDRDRLVVRLTLEKVRRWIRGYRGDPEEMSDYILKRVDGYADRLDLLLSGLVDRLVEE